MTLRDDDRLRERFLRLRAETEQPGRTPEFNVMLERARQEAAARPKLDVVPGGRTGASGPGRSHRRLLRAGAWASAALAATLAALLLTDGAPREDDEFERLVAAYSSGASGGSWQSPTSELLEVPGIELVRSLPSIGGAVRGLDPSILPTNEPQGQEENL